MATIWILETIYLFDTTNDWLKLIVNNRLSRLLYENNVTVESARFVTREVGIGWTGEDTNVWREIRWSEGDSLFRRDWSQLTDVWNTHPSRKQLLFGVSTFGFLRSLYRVPGQIHFETDRRVFDVYFQFFLSVILHCQIKRGISFKVHSYLQVWIRWLLYV